MGAFGQALFATPPKIGGVQLLPFSAFHAQALMELGSPILNGGDATSGDVAIALIVCSSYRCEGLGRVCDALNSPLQRLRWNLHWLRYDWRKACNQLVDYVIEGAKPPRIWRKIGGDGGESKMTGADWPFYVVSVVAQNFPSMDYRDLWDMPLNELFCHRVIYSEIEGSVEISERELGELERMKECE